MQVLPEKVSMNGRICKICWNMKRLSYLMALAMILTLSCQKDETSGDCVPDTDKCSRTLAASVADDSGKVPDYGGRTLFSC